MTIPVRLRHFVAGHGDDLERGAFYARCKPCGLAWVVTVDDGLALLRKDRRRLVLDDDEAVRS